MTKQEAMSLGLKAAVIAVQIEPLMKDWTEDELRMVVRIAYYAAGDPNTKERVGWQAVFLTAANSQLSVRKLEPEPMIVDKVIMAKEKLNDLLLQYSKHPKGGLI